MQNTNNKKEVAKNSLINILTNFNSKSEIERVIYFVDSTEIFAYSKMKELNIRKFMFEGVIYDFDKTKDNTENSQIKENSAKYYLHILHNLFTNDNNIVCVLPYALMEINKRFEEHLEKKSNFFDRVKEQINLKAWGNNAEDLTNLLTFIQNQTSEPSKIQDYFDDFFSNLGYSQITDFYNKQDENNKIKQVLNKVSLLNFGKRSVFNKIEETFGIKFEKEDFEELIGKDNGEEFNQKLQKLHEYRQRLLSIRKSECPHPEIADIVCVSYLDDYFKKYNIRCKIVSSSVDFYSLTQKPLDEKNLPITHPFFLTKFVDHTKSKEFYNMVQELKEKINNDNQDDSDYTYLRKWFNYSSVLLEFAKKEESYIGKALQGLKKRESNDSQIKDNDIADIANFIKDLASTFTLENQQQKSIYSYFKQDFDFSAFDAIENQFNSDNDLYLNNNSLLMNLVCIDELKKHFYFILSSSTGNGENTSTKGEDMSTLIFHLHSPKKSRLLPTIEKGKQKATQKIENNIFPQTLNNSNITDTNLTLKQLLTDIPNNDNKITSQTIIEILNLSIIYGAVLLIRDKPFLSGKFCSQAIKLFLFYREKSQSEPILETIDLLAKELYFIRSLTSRKYAFKLQHNNQKNKNVDRSSSFHFARVNKDLYYAQKITLQHNLEDDSRIILSRLSCYTEHISKSVESINEVLDEGRMSSIYWSNQTHVNTIICLLNHLEKKQEQSTGEQKIYYDYLKARASQILLINLYLMMSLNYFSNFDALYNPLIAYDEHKLLGFKDHEVWIKTLYDFKEEGFYFSTKEHLMRFGEYLNKITQLRGDYIKKNDRESTIKTWKDAIDEFKKSIIVEKDKATKKNSNNFFPVLVEKMDKRMKEILETHYFIKIRYTDNIPKKS